uniref:Olfactomedin-like domain-containing protein n=1 Tax=Globodera pallida TaxID=36090 RepID=A0A183CJ93_GLOPA
MEQPKSTAKSTRQIANANKWTVLVGHDTIIPKQVFELSCQRVHRYCAEKGQKLRGYRGPPGAKGRRGPLGRMGPIGPVGDIGAEGPPGSDGRCNCSLPDLYVQRVPVPGPPIPVEKLVPVPVVVLKEVEVTKLVPFEPTPPGFAPPLGWVPGMAMPDQSKTRLLPPPAHPTSPSQFRHWWSRPWRRRSTTTTTTTPASPTPPPPPTHSTDISSNVTVPGPTSPKPYVGPPTLGENQRECRLNAVGIPVLHAESQYGLTGSWFRDSMPRADQWAKKRETTKKCIFIDVPWYNPYRGLTQLSYNPVDSRLYFFDNGKLLSVNVRMEEPEYYDEQAELLLGSG